MITNLRSIEHLKKEITNLDAQYDKCQDVWSKGEVEGFYTEELLADGISGSHLFLFQLKDFN